LPALEVSCEEGLRPCTCSREFRSRPPCASLFVHDSRRSVSTRGSFVLDRPSCVEQFAAQMHRRERTEPAPQIFRANPTFCRFEHSHGEPIVNSRWNKGHWCDSTRPVELQHALTEVEEEDSVWTSCWNENDSSRMPLLPNESSIQFW